MQPMRSGVQLRFISTFFCTSSATLLMAGKEAGSMRISVVEDGSCPETEVAIRCKRADKQVIDILARLRMADCKVMGFAGKTTRIVNAEDVCYAESVDGRTFIYLANEVLESPLRLYEVEDRFSEFGFVRIGKSCVVNFNKIVSFEPEMNARLKATLENGEAVIVSRQYVPAVKRMLGML